MTDQVLLHIAGNSPEPVRSQIARQVRSRILGGDLPEGLEIPPAHRLAREHRVGVREAQAALDELESEGLLEAGQGTVRVAVVSAAQRRELAQRRLLDDLRQQELSLRELELARDIQRRLLPPARVETPSLRVVSRWFPARFVAGDFYDVLRLADGGVGVVVADVAGKGFGASLLMASVKAMTPFIAGECGARETLGELNRRIHGTLGRGQFVALSYAKFSPSGAEVEIANAGMPDPFLVPLGASPEPVVVDGPRLPLGIRAEVPYTSITRRLHAGDRLFLFSDGLPEARRPSGEPLGYEVLPGLLGRASSEGRRPGVEEWLDDVVDEVQRATGALDDDVTAVAVERRDERSER